MKLLGTSPGAVAYGSVSNQPKVGSGTIGNKSRDEVPGFTIGAEFDRTAFTEHRVDDAVGIRAVGAEGIAEDDEVDAEGIARVVVDVVVEGKYETAPSADRDEF